MVLKLASKLHKDLLAADRIAQFLYDLLDLVIKLRLGADNMESVNQLGHDFAGVVAILRRHHAD